MDWLIENWRFLVEIALMVISIIIVILKKAKVIKSDSAYSLVLEKLPSIIQTAENAFGQGNGDKKLSFVLELSFKLYESLTGSMSREEFSLSVSPVIESILSTPKKK